MKSKSMLFEIVKKEIRDVVRDKKTLIAMVAIPLLLYPLMFGFLAILQDARINADKTNYNKIGFAFEPDSAMNTVIEELEIDKVRETEEKLKEELESGKIDGYITLKDKEFTIYYSGKNNYGIATLSIANQLIEGYKRAIQSQMLTSEGLIPDEIFNVYTVKEEDASNTNAMAEYMMGLIPTFILMTTALTAIFAAIDMTAGEKERGTLETLLTFPLKTGDIIGGKFLATVICTVISAIIGFISMYGVLCYLSSTLESFKGINLLSYGDICLILVLFVIFAMLISALAIVIASRAKSFKEAQNSTEPLSLIIMIPMFLSIMGTKLDMKLSMVPLVNINLLLSDIISNNVNMQYVFITILSNIIFTFILMKSMIKLFKSDKILFS